MKNVIPLLFVILLSTTSTAQVMKPRHIPNQNIDFVGFAALTSQLEPLREAYRISEAEFIEISKDEDTIVLDTRILIYCNNNFENASKPFPLKKAVAALIRNDDTLVHKAGTQTCKYLGVRFSQT